MKKCLWLLSALTLSACYGGAGAPSSSYTPSISEPQFDSMGEIDNTNGFHRTYGNCSDQYVVDPRLRPGQSFSLADESVKYGSSTVHSDTFNVRIQTAQPDHLIIYASGYQDGQMLAGTQEQNCKKGASGWDCKQTQSITELDGQSSKDCKTRWDYVSGSDSANLYEVGRVTLPSGDRVIAVKSTFTNKEKSACDGGPTVDERVVEIKTYALPDFWAGSEHCMRTVYYSTTRKDASTGSIVDGFREIMTANPSVKSLAAYPGLDPIKLFPVKMPLVAQPDPAPQAQPSSSAQP